MAMRHIFLGKEPIKRNLNVSEVEEQKPILWKEPERLSEKRFYDLLITFLSLVFIASWLFPLIAILIKLTSKGPVFFKQLRHGKDNIPFYCYKFRTMVINEDADTLQARKNDNRVTKIGFILRRSSLDELPQLFNVIKGEMSIVGPRPHSVLMNEIFAKEIPGYMNRHNMKPGITGLAQSKGFRGEINNFYDLNARYKLDMFYLNNWCLYFDFKIIMWTCYSVLFRNSKAY
jgi:putative colanic acid biosynthesis UDP-glucose lipid carrier transferase